MVFLLEDRACSVDKRTVVEYAFLHGYIEKLYCTENKLLLIYNQKINYRLPLKNRLAPSAVRPGGFGTCGPGTANTQ